MFPFASILKQAYALTRHHKFLWMFGLFLFWPNMFNLVFFTSGRNQSNIKTPAVQPWLDTHQAVSWLVLIALVVLFFVAAFMFFRAKAGHIAAVKALVDKKETSFGMAYVSAEPFFGRVFASVVLMGLVVLSAVVIVGIPIIYLASFQILWRTVILACLGLIVIFPIVIVAILISSLAPMYVVIFDLKIGEAIKNSFNLISQYWVELILFSFSLVLIGIFMFFLAVFTASVIVSPFVIFGVLSYHKEGLLLSSILFWIAGIVGSIIFLTLLAIFSSFQQTSWVLLFLNINKTEKLPEEKTASVPEVVG